MRGSILAVVLTLLSLLGAGTALASPSIHTSPQGQRAGSLTRAALNATDCGANWEHCTQAMLTLINGDRAAHGLALLRLDPLQSLGTEFCLGSYRHSIAMAVTGDIWHVYAHDPQASFPHNICRHSRNVGENVGESDSGATLNDLRVLNRLMMQEPHSASICDHTVNHVCNLLSSSFRRVGIGIYRTGSTTWLTEDFTG